MKNVTFLLPAYNEEKSIGPLLSNIQSLYPYSQIIVVNNNSTDKTQEIAENFDVIVLSEEKQGKGNAIKKGFKFISTEYAVMLDADNTYNPSEARSLIDYLKVNKADIIMGSRLKGNREKGSITKFNVIGNHILSFFASVLYSQISDVCTGYWAFKKNFIDYLLEEGIIANGFELEVEMFLKASKGNFKIIEIPIRYSKRSDITKLNSIRDGWKIFRTLIYYKFPNSFEISNSQQNAIYEASEDE